MQLLGAILRGVSLFEFTVFIHMRCHDNNVAQIIPPVMSFDAASQMDFIWTDVTWIIFGRAPGCHPAPTATGSVNKYGDPRCLSKPVH